MERALEMIKERRVSDAKRKVEALENEKGSAEKTLKETGRLRLQKRREIKESVTGTAEKLSLAKKNLSFLQSEEFGKRLENWKPWELNEHSIKQGKNLNLKILKGHASVHVKRWVSDLASTHKVPENGVWIGILESIRKAQWETVKFLIEKKGFPLRNISHSIISEYPPIGIGMLNLALFITKTGRKISPGLFDAEELVDKAEMKKTIENYKLADVKKINSGNRIVVASSQNNSMGLHGVLVKSGMDAYAAERSPANKYVKDLLAAIARETVFLSHPQIHTLQEEIRKMRLSEATEEERYRKENEFLGDLNEDATKNLLEKHEEIFSPLIRRLEKRKIRPL